jgi:hypothetical protein
MIFGAPIIRSLSSRGLVGIIALAVGLAASSPCFSQTISLGQAAPYSIFEASVAGVTPGSVNLSGTSVIGDVAFGAGTSFSTLNTTLGGSVYEDSNVTFSASGTTVAGGVYPGTNLAQAATDAGNASTAAAGTPTAPVAANNSFSNNYTIAGNTGANASLVNVVNFTQPLSLYGTTITINGTPSQQFVFNFSQSLSLLDTTIVLNDVSASNVFFNITGGSVSISGSTFNGNIVDMAGTSINLYGDNITGSVISDGSVSMTNSSIGPDSPAGVSESSVAPELPTIMMAGLACVFVLGNAGRNLLRRRRLTLTVAPTQS